MKRLRLPISKIPLFNPLTVSALLIIFTIPLIIVALPNVAIIGGTLKSCIINPLINPAITDTMTAIISVTNTFKLVSLCNSAKTIQDSPVIAPPLMSIPPVDIIMVCATAKTPMIAHCFIRFVML